MNGTGSNKKEWTGSEIEDPTSSSHGNGEMCMKTIHEYQSATADTIPESGTKVSKEDKLSKTDQNEVAVTTGGIKILERFEAAKDPPATNDCTRTVRKANKILLQKSEMRRRRVRFNEQTLDSTGGQSILSGKSNQSTKTKGKVMQTALHLKRATTIRLSSAQESLTNPTQIMMKKPQKKRTTPHKR